MKINVSIRTRGMLEVLASGILFGLLGPLGKVAFNRGLAPFELLSLRFTLGGFLLLALIRGTHPHVFSLSKKTIGHLFLLGVSGYALFSSLYFFAIRELSASLAVLLLYTYPLMVTLFSFLLKIEKVSWRKLMALALAVFGMIALIGADFASSHFKGYLFGLGSAFFYSLYILASNRWLKGINPYLATGVIQLFAGGALCVLAFHDFARPLTIVQQSWDILLALAFFCTLGAMSLFQAGLQKLRPSETSLLSLSEPLSGVMLSILVMGESLSLMQVFGGILIMVSLLIVALEKSHEAQ